MTWNLSFKPTVEHYTTTELQNVLHGLAGGHDGELLAGLDTGEPPAVHVVGLAHLVGLALLNTVREFVGGTLELP